LKAVILVGGEGTRLRPLTCTTPKPMLPVVNVPFIEHIIKLLVSHDVKEIILSAGYLPAVFDEHLGDGDHLGAKITYVVEDKPLGTCGAVKNVEEYLDDTFVVFNGDILTDLNMSQLIEYHRAKKAIATLTLTSVDDPTQYGLVPIDVSGRIQEFLEKPSWDEVTTDLVNAGTYVLEPDILKLVPAGENHSFERHLFPLLIEKKQEIIGFPSSAYWLDIGTPEKYLQAHSDILDGKVGLSFGGEEARKNVWVGEGTKIADDAVVFGPVVTGKSCEVASHATVFSRSVLGNGCVIEAGARLERCVLYDGVHVGEGAVIKNSILGRNVKVGKKVHVEEEAILGDNTVVDEDNLLRRGIKIWPDTEIGQSKIRF